MYQYTTLINISNSLLYDVFLEAFQGFRIVEEADRESFYKMLESNGYDPELSVGAFDADTNELVGFVLNSIKTIDHERKAYVILTATKPMFRRLGIMRSLMELVKNMLLKENVSVYFTEVLKDHTGALKLYEAVGFEVIKEVETIVSTKAGSRQVIQYEIAVKLS